MSDPVALLIDFGSTYTKLRAVDLEARALVIRDGDIYVSLGRALDDAAAEEEPGIDRP